MTDAADAVLRRYGYRPTTWTRAGWGWIGWTERNEGEDSVKRCVLYPTPAGWRLYVACSDLTLRV